MKYLTVEVVGSTCVVRDLDGATVLEVVGDKLNWAQSNIVGNSDVNFVSQYNATHRGDQDD